jgi:predicted metalloprotease with PDZ domain
MNLRLLPFLFLLFIISCSDEVAVKIPKAPAEVDLSTSFYYEVNLNDRSGDTFKVRLILNNLTNDNAVFQFPATVPGTYDIHNVGRFVTKFKAYNNRYQALPVTKLSTNQWMLSDPENTHVIEFEVSETFDTPVTEYPIFKMAGTSMENDHVLFNTFQVLGYPTGLKERDFYVNITHPSTWVVGTSLPKSETGMYFATNYDFLADNPILLGKLTKATTTVSTADVGVYAYSKGNLIAASQILTDIQQILNDASAFLKGLPVDRYNFLYLFDEFNAGALEHSYSSVYVLKDLPYTTNYGITLRNIAAHEFFHIVTPLNIHSEIIADFNFAEPTPSQHLWLYEGVTEWAAHVMQYRNGHISVQTLLSRFRTKKIITDNSNWVLSLTDLSLSCYTPQGGAEFNNVYYKGALVAALLDIRLLELSDGTRGLRELILELIETYGPDNAFSENNFFTVLIEMTHPEVDDFITKYIMGTDPLPIAEYFDKLGITFNPETNVFELNPEPTEAQQFLFDKWSVNF